MSVLHDCLLAFQGASELCASDLRSVTFAAAAECVFRRPQPQGFGKPAGFGAKKPAASAAAGGKKGGKGSASAAAPDRLADNATLSEANSRFKEVYLWHCEGIPSEPRLFVVSVRHVPTDPSELPEPALSDWVPVTYALVVDAAQKDGGEAVESAEAGIVATLPGTPCRLVV